MTIKKLKEIIEQYEYKDSDNVAIEINEKLYEPVVYDDEYSRHIGEPTLVFYKDTFNASDFVTFVTQKK